GEVATTACRRPPGGEGVASGSAGAVAVRATRRAVAGGVAETRRGEALGRTNASQLRGRQRTAATATTSGRLRRTIDVVAHYTGPRGARPTTGGTVVDKKAESRKKNDGPDAKKRPILLLEAPAETGRPER
ncbi:hypothetical protein THAOC_37397, partial [Thalassiosira oceanica]